MAVRFTKPTSFEEALANGTHPQKKHTMSSQTSSPRHNGVSPATGTFACQDKLPKLPIPVLESTCERYLNALRPLQTNREHQDTKSAVQQFLKSDGPELNERLKKYATGRTSYIEQFCKASLCMHISVLTSRRVRLVPELR